VLQALTNQDFVHRHSAAHALSEAGSDFDKVVPALIEVVKIGGTNDVDRLMRGAAANALVELRKEPELVVPVFSEFLTSPDVNKRLLGAIDLGGLGADAKAAIPLLLKLRTDADPDVREYAARALRKIDPKAAADAGLK
jgi:HEAT repeat protein